MITVRELSNRILQSGHTQRAISAGSGICASTIRSIIDMEREPHLKTVVSLLIYLDLAPPPPKKGAGRPMRGPKSLVGEGQP